MESGSLRSASPRFGMDPAEVDRLARAWTAQAATARSVDLVALKSISQPSSRTMIAVAAVAAPAEGAARALAGRLESMTESLHTLTVVAEGEDVAAAAVFDDAIGR